MRLKGLEPPRLSAPDPKSGAATNYATAAKALQKYENIFKTKINSLIFFILNQFLFQKALLNRPSSLFVFFRQPILIHKG